MSFLSKALVAFFFSFLLQKEGVGESKWFV